VAIAEVREGQRAAVRGRVQQAEKLLQAPVSKRACVAYEIRSDTRRLAGEVCDFVVADDSGRALVVTEPCHLDLGATDQAAVISVVDADLTQIEARLSDLKVQIRRDPHKQQELAPKIRRAKKLATLLCAVRAHLNGNVHVGGSLKGQERFIRKESAAYEGLARDVPARFLERCDVALEVGEEVIVEGIGRWEADPDPAARPTGYRQRPKRLVLRAPPDGVVRIRVAGTLAPRLLSTELLLDAALPARQHSAAPLGVLLVVLAVLGAAWYLL
jgi:hypothetical protein